MLSVDYSKRIHAHKTHTHLPHSHAYTHIQTQKITTHTHTHTCAQLIQSTFPPIQSPQTIHRQGFLEGLMLRFECHR